MSRVQRRPVDPRGGHVRIYWDVLDSHAWHALSYVEQAVYLAMSRQLRGSNNGDIEATLGTLRHHGITSSATLAKSLRALLTVGLIAVNRQGGMSQGGKQATLYRFTDAPALEFKKKTGPIPASRATNEWKAWPSRAAAVAAIEAAHAAAKRPKHRSSKQSQNTSPVRAANRISSRREPEGGFSDSRRELCGPPLRSSGEACETTPNAAATRADAHSDAERLTTEQPTPHASANEHLLHVAIPASAAGIARATPLPSLTAQLLARNREQSIQPTT